MDEAPGQTDAAHIDLFLAFGREIQALARLTKESQRSMLADMLAEANTMRKQMLQTLLDHHEKLCAAAMEDLLRAHCPCILDLAANARALQARWTVAHSPESASRVALGVVACASVAPAAAVTAAAGEGSDVIALLPAGNAEDTLQRAMGVLAAPTCVEAWLESLPLLAVEKVRVRVPSPPPPLPTEKNKNILKNIPSSIQGPPRVPILGSYMGHRRTPCRATLDFDPT